ncbi:hypothetical protein D3C77_647420 [compost metagenome]
MGIPPGLGLAKLVFQGLGELVLPLGLRLLLVGACDPVRTEFVEGFCGNGFGDGVAKRGWAPGLCLWLPAVVHGEVAARGESSRAFNG